MSKEPIEYLKHIADECSYIISVSNNLSKDEFFETDVTQPIDPSQNPSFQQAVVAYLYHGVPALMLYPWGEFWEVLSVALRLTPTVVPVPGSTSWLAYPT